MTSNQMLEYIVKLQVRGPQHAFTPFQYNNTIIIILLQQYRLNRAYMVILCRLYYSIAVYTTLPSMPNLQYAISIHD